MLSTKCFHRASCVAHQKRSWIRARVELAQNRIFSQRYDSKGTIQQAIIRTEGPKLQRDGVKRRASALHLCAVSARALRLASLRVAADILPETGEMAGFGCYLG